MSTTTEFALTDQQIRFYESFGFLKIPGLFAHDIERIEAAFEAVFAAEDTPFYLPSENEFHDTDDDAYAETLRQIIPGFLDKSPELSWLKDDPRVLGTVRSLLGDHIAYAESDGNLFNCDVYWHTDLYGADASKENLKLFFYLDALHEDSGALRVLPGTHHHQGIYGQTMRSDLYMPDKGTELYGIDLQDFPSHTIDVEPGDLVVMNFRVLHGSWNGAPGRKLFTVNFTQAEA